MESDNQKVEIEVKINENYAAGASLGGTGDGVDSGSAQGGDVQVSGRRSNEMQMPKKKEIALVWKIGVPLVAILLFVTIIFSFVEDKSYEKPIQNYASIVSGKKLANKYYYGLVGGTQKGDYESRLMKQLDKINGTDKVGELIQEYQEVSKEAKGKYGKDFVCTYEVADKKPVTSGELEAVKQSWKEESVELFSLYKTNIESSDKYSSKERKKLVALCDEAYGVLKKLQPQEGYMVKIRYTEKGSKKQNTEEEEVAIAKVGKEWVIFRDVSMNN